MSIESMFEQDADALKVKDNDLDGLAALARRALPRNRRPPVRRTARRGFR